MTLKFSPSWMFISIDSIITEAAIGGVLLKKGVLKNFATFLHRKTSMLESLFNKVTINKIEEPGSWTLSNVLIKIYLLGTKKWTCRIKQALKMKSDLVWLVSESSIDCKYGLKERGLYLPCFGKNENLCEERGRY